MSAAGRDAATGRWFVGPCKIMAVALLWPLVFLEMPLALAIDGLTWVADEWRNGGSHV